MKHLRTEQQEEAALYEGDKLAITACPGSGKTTTLVDRIVEFEQDDVLLRHIGIVTYTNAAARVIADRATRRMIPDEHRTEKTASVLFGHCGTLHSLIFALVRCEHRVRGWKPPTILPEEAALSLIHRCSEDVNYKGSDKKLKECYERTKYEELPDRKNPEELVIAHYRRTLAQEGFYDYNSLLVFGLALVKGAAHEETQLAINSIRHLIVDEFQDAAPVDIEIILNWPALTRTVVGDSNQCIFGFRGSDPTALNKFISVGGFHQIKLTKNFRSTPQIIKAANSLIGFNVDNGGSVMETDNPDGMDVMLIDGPSQEALKVSVASQLSAEREHHHTEWHEMAVLCRTNIIAESYRNALRAVNIPVEQEILATSRGDWPHLKLWLSFLACPTNDLILGLLLESGAMDDSMIDEARIRGVPANSIHKLVPENSPAMSLSDLFITARTFNVDSHGVEYLMANHPDKTPGELLTILKGEQDIPSVRVEGVAVVTAHSAKGREWDFVVVTEMNEGIWPLGSCAKVPAELREERRLAYVAMTRARKRLVLGSSRTTIPPWGRRPEPCQPSRFINEALRSF